MPKVPNRIAIGWVDRMLEIRPLRPDDAEWKRRLGMHLGRLHHDGVVCSRVVKPTIPLTGLNGVPIRHEFELVPESGR